MNAEIIAIGDEITSGQSLDTNSAWLSQQLEELGVRVLAHTAVGDELAPCVEAFRAAVARAEIVVATGGLGPTADDLTRQVLAEAFGRPLRLDAASLEAIRAKFARRGWPMSPSNELQAYFPEGSRPVPNRVGTAPGIEIDVPREDCLSCAGRLPSPISVASSKDRQPESPSLCRIICLPGVPAEMFEMWRESVRPSLAAFVGPARRVVRRRTLRCFGAGESRIEAMLPDLIRRGRRPTVGITASQSTISLRIVADGETEQECLAAIEPVAATIRQCLGTLVFGEGDDELQHAVVRRLRERGKSLATVECATAGLLAEQIGGVAGAMDVFRGGWVLPKLHEPVEAAASRCREHFAADYALAVGSYLPSPFGSGDGGEGVEAGGQDDEPRTIALALSSPAGVQSARAALPLHPALSRVFCAKQALNLLRLALLR